MLSTILLLDLVIYTNVNENVAFEDIGSARIRPAGQRDKRIVLLPSESNDAIESH